MLELLEDLPVIMVGVHCLLEELEQRERQRKDRKKGLARLQIGQVHAQAEYDVHLDTSLLSPDECAHRILEAMQEGHQPSAFERLREKRTASRLAQQSHSQSHLTETCSATESSVCAACSRAGKCPGATVISPRCRSGYTRQACRGKRSFDPGRVSDGVSLTSGPSPLAVYPVRVPERPRLP